LTRDMQLVYPNFSSNISCMSDEFRDLDDVEFVHQIFRER